MSDNKMIILSEGWEAWKCPRCAEVVYLGKTQAEAMRIIQKVKEHHKCKQTETVK